MALYLLTPTQIGTEVSLFEAIYWIAYEYFPKKFYTLPDDIEIWARFELITQHKDFLNYILLDKLNISSDHLILNSRLQFFPDEYCLNELRKAEEEAFIKIYNLFNAKSLRLYATNNYGQISGHDFALLDSSAFSFKDFNLYAQEQPVITSKNRTYYNILVSFEDLLKHFPLKYTETNKVKYASGNYFVDDTNNKEIVFKARGRKPLLTPEQLTELFSHVDTIKKDTPSILQESLIYEAINYAKNAFNIDVSRTTMIEYIKSRK